MNSFASRLKDISTIRVSGKAAFGKRNWAKISCRDGLCSLLILLLVPVQAVFGVIDSHGGWDGTAPQESNSRFLANNIVVTSCCVALPWPGFPGLLYQVIQDRILA